VHDAVGVSCGGGVEPVLLVQDGVEGGRDEANQRFVVVVAEGAVSSVSLSLGSFEDSG
jgi:hypothetical protein